MSSQLDFILLLQMVQCAADSLPQPKTLHEQQIHRTALFLIEDIQTRDESFIRRVHEVMNSYQG